MPKGSVPPFRMRLRNFLPNFWGRRAINRKALLNRTTLDTVAIAVRTVRTPIKREKLTETLSALATISLSRCDKFERMSHTVTWKWRRYPQTPLLCQVGRGSDAFLEGHHQCLYYD